MLSRRQTLKAVLAAPFLGLLGLVRARKEVGLPKIGEPYPGSKSERYIWVPDLSSKHVSNNASSGKYDIVHGTPS